MKMKYGPDGQERCECGFDLHEMVSPHGEPDGFVCADCVTFYDGNGKCVGGPYLPPSDLIHEIDEAARNDKTDAPMIDALARVRDFFAHARTAAHAA